MDNKELVAAIHRMELNVTKKLTAMEATLDQHCDRLDILFDKAERSDQALFGMGEGDGLVTRAKLLEEAKGKTNIAVAGSYTGVLGWIIKLWTDLVP